jgi:hypothetical protein
MKCLKKIIFLTSFIVTLTLLVGPAFAEVIFDELLDTYAVCGPSPDCAAGPYSLGTLVSGKPYLITVQGTFSLWYAIRWEENGVCPDMAAEEAPTWDSPSLPANNSNGMVGLDPEYLFAKPQGYICPDPYEGPIPSTVVQISLEGDSPGKFSHRTPTDRTYNPTHLYQYRVIGTGQEAFIKFSDSNPNDNYGRLRVIVESVATTAFATGGGIIQTANGKAILSLSARAKDGSVQGTMHYTNFNGLSISSMDLMEVEVFGNTARLAGQASVDREPGHAFVLFVQDQGNPGRNSDNFHLILDGSTIAKGALTGGNIWVLNF